MLHHFCPSSCSYSTFSIIDPLSFCCTPSTYHVLLSWYHPLPPPNSHSSHTIILGSPSSSSSSIVTPLSCYWCHSLSVGATTLSQAIVLHPLLLLVCMSLPSALLIIMIIIIVIIILLFHHWPYHATTLYWPIMPTPPPTIAASSHTTTLALLLPLWPLHHVVNATFAMLLPLPPPFPLALSFLFFFHYHCPYAMLTCSSPYHCRFDECLPLTPFSSASAITPLPYYNPLHPTTIGLMSITILIVILLTMPAYYAFSFFL